MRKHNTLMFKRSSSQFQALYSCIINIQCQYNKICSDAKHKRLAIYNVHTIRIYMFHLTTYYTLHLWIITFHFKYRFYLGVTQQWKKKNWKQLTHKLSWNQDNAHDLKITLIQLILPQNWFHHKSWEKKIVYFYQRKCFCLKLIYTDTPRQLTRILLTFL